MITASRCVIEKMKQIQHEGFQKLTSVDDALRIFLDTVQKPTLKPEIIKIGEASGRVLGEDVIARESIPSVDRSIMDGYAVRSEDVQSASKENPVELQLVGQSKLGFVCRQTLKFGQAIAVATGSTIPKGADSVQIVERTKKLKGPLITVYAPVNPGQNMSRVGEDVSPGRVVLRKSQRLRPQDVGILQALGLRRVRVVRRPKVALISTGDELVNFKSGLIEGKIVDLNRPILTAMVREAGGEPVDLGIAQDREVQVLRILRKGLSCSDVVLISAGSSLGSRDLVPKCIGALGEPGMLVHGIAMRPSMPTGLAFVKGKQIVSLPGFPVSAMISFKVFVRPLLSMLLGAQEQQECVVKAVLKERISGPSGYRTFVRVKLTRTREGLVAEPLGIQRSAVLMSMVDANGIVTIPEQVAAFEAGEAVDVSLIGQIES
jgi:molybdenum cofactor synthesis domain-containing protein